MVDISWGKRLVCALAVLALGLPAFAQQIHGELVASGLNQPVAFVQDPSQANVQFVVEQRGRIRPVVNGQLQEQDFLDLSDAGISTNAEGGLLGLAFAPDYGASGRFYVNFMDANDNTVIARFVRMAGEPLKADPGTRFDFVWPDGQAVIHQPYCCHDGGHLAFGPDGYLYIALGDGGAWDDPDHNAQNPQSLLGKMLRLDVSVPDDDPTGYRVPGDNPFVGQEGVLGEIWDAGLRNPWRYSFDDPAHGGTGALIIGDVGQDQWEEFDYEPPGRGGRNFGWRNREGAHDYVTSLPPWFEPLTDPTYEYSHDGNPKAVIGGYVYRGSALGADYAGRYFFGDFMTGRLWSVHLDVDSDSGEATAGDLRDHSDDIGPEPIDYFAAFGQDANGELYVVSWFHGTVYRLAPGPAVSTPHSDLRLSIDGPAGGSVTQPFAVGGWALDLASTTGTGVGSVQITVFPTSGAPTSLGPAAPETRDDVGAAFGPQFTQSGFGLVITGLTPGHYRIEAAANSTVVSGTVLTQSVDVDVLSGADLAVDEPQPNQTLRGPFAISGWGLDHSASGSTGVDAVHVWAFPAGAGDPRFIAAASYGRERADVAAVFGSQFLDSGWRVDGALLDPGDWTIVVFLHSGLTGEFVLSKSVPVHVADGLLLQVDAPSPGADIGQSSYVAGWALDLGSDGVGVDAVHVWAFPTDGSSPVFLGHSELGWQRADVAAAFGPQFLGSGFFVPFVLPPGAFDLYVFGRRTSTGSFDVVRGVHVTVH
jgi:glucose/arabinose dehydrogenase